MGKRQGPLEDLVTNSSFWKGRKVFVTGATGLVGSWLVKDLLKLGAQVSALVLDADPQSELFRSGDHKKISVVNGDLTDFWTVERAVSLLYAVLVGLPGIHSLRNRGRAAQPS